MAKYRYTTAIIGLGLMGGSLAYALRGFQDGLITGYDTDRDVMRRALRLGAIDCAAETLEQAVGDADLVMYCSSPQSIQTNMLHSFPHLKPGAVVSDICGVKKDILALAAEHLPPHIHYVGLHPMAGKEVGGFDNAEARLFKGAGFILVLPENCAQSAIDMLTALSRYVGAGRVVVNHANEHDAIIAYSSDLMHISAAALCADYPPSITMAHTAGAFRDCTRIAKIDAALWTELLSANAYNILPELKRYIATLERYAEALQSGDQTTLYEMLETANQNKASILSL